MYIKTTKNYMHFIFVLIFTCSLLAGCKAQFKLGQTSSKISKTVDVTVSMTPTETINKTKTPTPTPTPKPIIQEPKLIKTAYDTNYTVIADIVITEAPYNADNTGIEECTNIIQKAIEECYGRGGGTVYLPKGKYKVSGPITLKPFVSLCGDWQDPDEGNEYGTIILANVASSDSDFPALLTIPGSAGVVGLTIYYPNQSIDNVKPYPYTFYVPGEEKDVSGYMLQSIVNCTVINGYKGIGANTSKGNHEMMTVRNVKGTFLYRGASLFNSADVDTWKTAVFSNKYWADAGAGLEKADRKKIDEYTRANGIGFTVGSLEWAQFANISVSDYSIGINVVKGQRVDFTGSFYDLYIQNCVVGLKVDFIDTRWGLVIARGEIEGSIKSIINDTDGVVKMTGVKLIGDTNNRNIVIDETSLDSYKINYEYKISRNTKKMYVADGDKSGKVDSSESIQKILDKAGKNGGGIVYLPAGYYRIQKPLTVPANVELRGSSLVATREQVNVSLGTIILAYYGVNPTDADNDRALVTLNGDNSGIWGIRFIYPRNNPAAPDSMGQIKKYTYTIRGKGDGVYAVNVSISAGYNGIDFRNCNNTFIQRFVTVCYNNAMYLGNSSGGMIEDCIQNPNVIPRTNLRNIFDEFKQWLKEEEMNKFLLEPILRPNSIFIKIEKAKGLTIVNAFTYGIKTVISNNGGTDILVANSGSDGMGETSPMLWTKRGSMTCINVQRWRGFTYETDSTDLKIFNIIAIEDTTEPNVK